MPKKPKLLPMPFFGSSQQWLEKISQEYLPRNFKTGYYIPLQSANVWLVFQGIVQLSTVHRDGSEAILGLATPAIPFGLPFTQIDPYIAIALSDVVLISLSQVEIQASPVLAQGLLLQLTHRLQQTEALLATINQRFIGDRLQELLLLLTREFGQTTPNGIRIDVRLTHQQLANLIGTTRISVTRLLGYLRQEGWLSIDQTRHLVIHGSATVSLTIPSTNVKQYQVQNNSFTY